MIEKHSLTTFQKLVIILVVNIILLVGLLVYYLVMDHGQYTPAVKTILVYTLPFFISGLYLFFLAFIERVKITSDTFEIRTWYFHHLTFQISDISIISFPKEMVLFHQNGEYITTLWKQTSGVTEIIPLLDKNIQPIDTLLPSTYSKLTSRMSLLLFINLTSIVILLFNISLFWIGYIVIDFLFLVVAIVSNLFVNHWNIKIKEKEFVITNLFGKSKSYLVKSMSYQKTKKQLRLFSEGQQILSLGSKLTLEIGSVLSKIKVQTRKS